MKFAPLVALLVGACTAPNPYYDPLQILPPAPDLSGRWSTVDDGDMGAAPDLRAAPADMATCSTQGQSVDDGGVCCVGLDAIDGVCCVTCWRTPTDGVRACNVPHPTGAPCISAFCNWCASGICDLPTPEPDPFNPGQCR